MFSFIMGLPDNARSLKMAKPVSEHLSESDPDSAPPQHESINGFPRPRRWFCIWCGDPAKAYTDYVCSSCKQLRPFVGGSATIISCRRCSGWSLALARFCEWCGSPFE